MGVIELGAGRRSDTGATVQMAYRFFWHWQLIYEGYVERCLKFIIGALNVEIYCR